MARKSSIKRFTSTLTLGGLFLLSACSHTVQYTSGQDYLAGFTDTPSTNQTSIDLEVRDIAAIEPNINFPARIGIARIEQGRLITVPADEGENWSEMAKSLGPNYGELIPVSPLIASMVNPNTTSNEIGQVVNHIRRGAARQHLDYILIYEVTDLNHNDGNALQIADLSVLGLFILPSRNVEVKSTASAMLIDVRNGYPYGSASAFADEKSLSTVMSKRGKTRELSDKARIVSVQKLTDSVAEILTELKAVSTQSPETS